MDKYTLEVEEDEYWGEEHAFIYTDDEGEKVQIGFIGGEPEDNTYYRTYSWILPALNDAYKRGLRDGARKEYDRLRDKV